MLFFQLFLLGLCVWGGWGGWGLGVLGSWGLEGVTFIIFYSNIFFMYNEMNQNYLLLFMIVCYLIPIYYVYFYYECNHSVSNIICNDNYKKTILFFMLLMGVGTIFYELERNDSFSVILICVLLLGIYGLICINEHNTIHYVFAFLVFISILVFMIRHCYLTNNSILSLSLFVEVFLLLYIIMRLNNNMFYGEVFYILNFAFYYIYLHFIPLDVVGSNDVDVNDVCIVQDLNGLD